MKNIILILIAIPYFIISQEVTIENMSYDGLERSYILYVPTSYSEDIPTSLVLNLHGYSSNAGQQMIYSDFHTIADSEGFILIHPEGTVNDIGFQFWNVGEENQIDDIGFLSNLIDIVASEYNINTDRVYSMGMSNGGFMSYQLACQLSNKIAAIASVTGSMNEIQLTSCNPERPIPVMQIHGTADLTVLYQGNSMWGISSIDNVVSYWTSQNECQTEPIFNNIPDINGIDLCTAEHYVYPNGINGSSVELYKIINGGHTWPGATIPLVGNNTNQDFNASEKIWEFFNKYDINGLINEDVKIQESIENKEIVQTIDLLGRQSERLGLYINLYDDGSAKKIHIIK